MVNKLFKYSVPKDKIVSFIQSHLWCEPNHSHKTYILTFELYKKLMYNKVIEEWVYQLKPYYYPSKQFYVERSLTYKHFATILRQLCRHHAISFSSNIQYQRSQYTTHYHIILSHTQE